jgi:predicted nucleic acid-binding protein
VQLVTSEVTIATYVAAAEHLQVDLLTRDEGILTARGVHCRVRRP